MRSASRSVARIAIFAAVYVALVFVFQPISFMQIQLRVADAMLGTIPLLGWEGAVGYALGVLIGNTMSPLGPIDLLSSIPSLIGGLIVAWMGRKWGGRGFVVSSIINALIISAWVAYMLQLVLNLPYFINFAYVFIGCFISMTIFGSIIYKATSKLEAVVKK